MTDLAPSPTWDVLDGGGEMGRLMRARDWSRSPAGRPQTWPPAIAAAVSLCLASPMPIIVWIGQTSDALVQLYNDAYRPVLGADKHPRALGGVGCEVWPEIWHIMGPIFDRVLAGAPVLREDQPMVLHRNGYPEETWFTHAHSPIRDEAGQVVGVFTVVNETTAQQRAARALRQREQQLQLFIDGAPAGIAMFDRDMRYLAASRRMVADLRLPPGTEVVGRSHYEVFPDLPERWHDVHRRVLAGETLSADDDPYPRADGTTDWVRWEMRPWHEADGQIGGAVLFSEIVTARREARERLAASERALGELNARLEQRVIERTAALAESERRFRAIFDTTFQLTGLAALDGTIIVVNRAALDTVGATQEQVAGAKMWDSPWWRDDPAEAAQVRDGVARVARGEFVRYESRLALPDGVHVYDFSMKPVLDAAGRPAFLVAEGRDITEQRQAEEGLRQAQKMEAVGQLTGGIAHDFNNLLQGVAGSLDLIRRKPEERERVRRWAEAGLQAAERGTKLTGQLLAFSRAQRLEVRPVAVAALVSNLRELLERTLGPSVRLRIDLGDDGAVLGDEVQLEMALLNLAINARDAMPGGGDLTITARPCRVEGHPELPPGEYVELAVADTGHGMPPDVAARAFDPFFTTKGVGKGTGLGLSQVYGTVRQAGGAVRIETAPGAGTTVRMLLRPALLPAVSEAAPPGPAAPDAPLAKILVVDDDPGVRRFLADSLDALGYEPVEATDGRSGLAALDHLWVDAVILDFAMPDMTGAEVAKEARVRRPGLPIVFATGFAETAATEDAAAGVPVLRKPFGLDELQAALSAALAPAAR